MNKKYVIQAFEMKLKGRFDLLARFYGDYLFQIPAKIIIQQVKDELGIDITEDAIYNLNRRRKNRLATLPPPLLPATSQPIPHAGASPSTLPKQSPPHPLPDQDWGSVVENATKQPKGKNDNELDFKDF